MIHTARRYQLRTVQSLTELAALLTAHTWTLCQAFHLPTDGRGHDLLFLNDSFSEDGAQEYAVVDVATDRQVESLTVSWMTAERCADAISSVWMQGASAKPDLGPCTPRLDHGRGTCRFCA